MDAAGRAVPPPWWTEAPRMPGGGPTLVANKRWASPPERPHPGRPPHDAEHRLWGLGDRGPQR
eukprot:1532903-Lingulodinium_polyedra.AAC.1